ncbi:class I SAM-dependent methyltransferase [Streptomyces sp. NPDC046887]|uniref:class I SAM-dependent methyltransferase n=1 Tax=Streptomyces sp. NPDC046887 TaxID=3155472 RepID=UPI003403E374
MGLPSAYEAAERVAGEAADPAADETSARATVALADLRALGEAYRRAMETAAATPETRAAMEVFVAEFSAAVQHCLTEGAGDEEIAAAVAPLRDALGSSPLIRRGQRQDRGHPGDFEMIEYLLSGRNDAEPGTLAWQIDSYLQDSAITRQHRNKIAHQAGLIRRTLSGPSADGGGRRVLLVACGGAADLRTVEPELFAAGDLVVLNDVDADALEYARAALPPATALHTTVEPGNVLQALPALERRGPYDLVLAGGLFDYLPDRYARLLIAYAMTRLCVPGGDFHFSNIAAGNPFAHLMKYLADWPLIERTRQDVEALVRAAAPHQTARLSVGADQTGYTLLAHLTRAAAPVRSG